VIQSVQRARAPVQQAVSTAVSNNVIDPFGSAQTQENSQFQLVSTQPRLIASTPQPEYEYIEYYEYYDIDDEETDTEHAASLDPVRRPEQAPFTKVGAAAAHPPPVKTIGDYDLFPLVNKVQINADGTPVCHDVGVFPHPDSCRQFVTCSRRTLTSSIVGWVYECPSYLAFDPVGGRCNWASDVVCK